MKIYRDKTLKKALYKNIAILAAAVAATVLIVKKTESKPSPETDTAAE